MTEACTSLWARTGALVAALALAPAGWGGGGGFAPDEVVVRLVPGGDIAIVNLVFGTTVLAQISQERIYLLGVPPGSDEEVLVPLIDALPVVEWADLNILLATMDGTTGSFFVSVSPQDYDQQYALSLINPADPDGGVEVRVAVLDTGVDESHPELAGRVSSQGFDFVDVDGNPDDEGNGEDEDGDGEADELVGHGTHIAGVVALVAANAEILPVRILNGEGSGYAFQAAQGIYWAISHGAGVINLSATSSSDSKVLDHAMDSAADADIIAVSAAGNLNQADPQYPAAYETTVAVASTDACNHKSSFSNYGEHIRISAPGTQIVGTVPGGGYGAADGTSFAAAFVSAGAATLRGAWPQESAAQITADLMTLADPLDELNPGFAGTLGAGRLDIMAALVQGPVPPCPGDLDDDGAVGRQDLLALLAAWGYNPGHPADLDGDCDVGRDDVEMLVDNWGLCP